MDNRPWDVLLPCQKKMRGKTRGEVMRIASGVSVSRFPELRERGLLKLFLVEGGGKIENGAAASGEANGGRGRAVDRNFRGQRGHVLSGRVSQEAFQLVGQAQAVPNHQSRPH